MSAVAEEFEAQRPLLFGLAYRLLGSAAEAEDAVQDAYLRLHAADRAAIGSLRAWLTKVVTNLCLNQLTSARARRETYVGPWLPEPVITGDGTLGPLETTEQRDSVSIALLTLMERLSPGERAALVLREAFGYGHREIADMLETSDANVRQLHHRARQRLVEPTPRFRPDPAQWRELGRTVLDRQPQRRRDRARHDVDRRRHVHRRRRREGGRCPASGGGPRPGSPIPRRCLEPIGGCCEVRLEFAEVNGEPAMLGFIDATLAGVLFFEVDGDRIAALRVVANPDKLRFAARQLSHPADLSGQ